MPRPILTLDQVNPVTGFRHVVLFRPANANERDDRGKWWRGMTDEELQAEFANDVLRYAISAMVGDETDNGRDDEMAIFKRVVKTLDGSGYYRVVDAMPAFGPLPIADDVPSLAGLDTLAKIIGNSVKASNRAHALSLFAQQPPGVGQPIVRGPVLTEPLKSAAARRADEAEQDAMPARTATVVASTNALQDQGVDRQLIGGMRARFDHVAKRGVGGRVYVYYRLVVNGKVAPGTGNMIATDWIKLKRLVDDADDAAQDRRVRKGDVVEAIASGTGGVRYRYPFVAKSSGRMPRAKWAKLPKPEDVYAKHPRIFDGEYVAKAGGIEGDQVAFTYHAGQAGQALTIGTMRIDQWLKLPIDKSVARAMVADKRPRTLKGKTVYYFDTVKRADGKPDVRYAAHSKRRDESAVVGSMSMKKWNRMKPVDPRSGTSSSIPVGGGPAEFK